MNDFIRIIPEIFLLISSLFILLVNTRKEILVFGVLLITLTLVICQQCSYSELLFSNFIAISPFIQFLKIVILSLSAFVVLMMSSVKEVYSNELPLLVAFSTLGMISMVSSHDLLSMYMAIELQSMPAYIMAAIDRKSLLSSEAGVKYFVTGALASGLLLYGISMLYGFVGSTNFTDLTQVFRSGEIELGVLVGTILIISAFAFKVAAAPFHMWVPDVYQGSPTVVTAFFASVPKFALVALLIRLFNYELLNIKLQQVFILLSMLSLVVSAFGALKQSNIKRLVAYSSIGHIGYIFIGVVSSMEVQANVIAVIMYTTLYSLMNIGLFSVIFRFASYEIKSLPGLYKQHPVISVCLTVLLFSMAGIPPTGGFFTKLYILSSAVDSGFLWLAFFALTMSVISTYYYLWIIKIIYFDSSTEKEAKLSKSYILSGITLIMAAINLVFPLFVGSNVGFLSNIVNYL